MTPEQQARLDRVVAFHAGLVQLRDMLRVHDEAAATAEKAGRLRVPAPPELEELRQALLRQSGPVEALYVRRTGRLVQPMPFNSGPADSVWQLALMGHPVYSQTFFAGVLADELSTFIGRLEDDPALLDPPREQPAPQRDKPQQSQTINVYGGIVQAGQTLGGGLLQTNAPAVDRGEILQILGELRRTIEELDASDEERETFVEPVADLVREMEKPDPVRARLIRFWGTVQAFATIEGTWQGWDRVQKLATEAARLIQPMLQSPPAPPPGTLA